ncbi:tyrosine-protein phosphatase corkscrew-like isoform X1 [Stegostoma tigrinum]|uniref:tyrosine-protein phosphatase corkscrew-like isoform X1 n=1 Tax=Stegostoma tigrinum TaxID=3053191 RepID=UPI00202AD3B1|nr:tyrosine-protein phosphatase corkscrew-like isoform X1 [Stegostoma tigrinum]
MLQTEREEIEEKQSGVQPDGMGKRPCISLASVLLSLKSLGCLEYAAHKGKHSQTLPTASPVSASFETGGRQGEGKPAAQKAVTETVRLPFYHGKISKAQTEDLLASSGKNGSYLIRDSETVPGSYCLCVFGIQYDLSITVQKAGLSAVERNPRKETCTHPKQSKYVNKSRKNSGSCKSETKTEIAGKAQRVWQRLRRESRVNVSGPMILSQN